MSSRPGRQQSTDWPCGLRCLSAWGVLGLSMLVTVAPAAAQVVTTLPGPYVVDVRGTTVGIPRGAAFFPAVPQTTQIPSRGFGVDVGAHVYLVQFGPSRLGVGADLLRARGTSSPGKNATSGSGPNTRPSQPDVAATVTAVAPQVSFNFGSAEGWSYISGGWGVAQIRSSTSAFGLSGTGTGTGVVPAQVVDNGYRPSVNVGGGARWFTAKHTAFSFDIRFHVVMAGPKGASDTPGATLVAASAGISLR